jgi:hypothetical protein
VVKRRQAVETAPGASRPQTGLRPRALAGRCAGRPAAWSAGRRWAPPLSLPLVARALQPLRVPGTRTLGCASRAEASCPHSRQLRWLARPCLRGFPQLRLAQRGQPGTNARQRWRGESAQAALRARPLAGTGPAAWAACGGWASAFSPAALGRAAQFPHSPSRRSVARPDLVAAGPQARFHPPATLLENGL